jgi:hypothetical protein
MLEIPPILDVVLIILLLAFIFIVAHGDGDMMGQGKHIWLAGMVIIVSAYVISLIPVSSVLVDRVLRVVLVNMRLNVGYLLAALAVVYWWPRQMNLYVIGGIAALVGTLASFIPLIAIEQSPLSGWIVAAGILIGALLLMREMTNPVNAREAWVNLSMIIILFSLGILATVLSVPRVAAFAQGTFLTGLQLNLIALGVLLINMGFARRVVTNRHSTTAFWLITLGLVAGNLALLIAAGAQTIMERVLTIGYLDVQNALVPLYALWISGLLVMGCGLLWMLQTMVIAPQSEA